MKKRTTRQIMTASSLGLLAALWMVVGCQTSVKPVAGNAATAPVTESARGGSQIWAESCVRCHNIPSVSRYSDAQWQVAVQHMRIRANLTAEEGRKITEFLKSAN